MSVKYSKELIQNILKTLHLSWSDSSNDCFAKDFFNKPIFEPIRKIWDAELVKPSLKSLNLYNNALT